MSSTPVQDPPVQGLSSDSSQTLPSRPPQHVSDPSASKRVCFYKSGDYKFSGHRMVVNVRIFKTFDALLDALSKKVPLPFGVRTITTPRGTHSIKALDELHDGGAYVCSDQKRVKPLNLDEVTRRQVPWNTTRPLSVGQGVRPGQLSQRNRVTGRPVKVMERVAVRTPKRLTVIKNKDPTVKRTIVLQRRTAPTFDALLDYLSQILQFPVLRLFATDGRRVDGLAALILCSGVVVAAGNEPFRLGSSSSHRPGQMAQTTYVETVEQSMLQPRLQKNKPLSSGRGSRNFSLSSERYIINQINKCQTGSVNQGDGSFEAEVNHTSMDTYGTRRKDTGHRACIVPQEDDIEKSFRVNQDGSMTVEMKVHLTIKEEEMLHWTTTLSRSTISKRTVCASVSGSGNSSPDSNNTLAKNSPSLSDGETKEDNYSAGARKGAGFNEEQIHEVDSSTALGKAKSSFSRTPTPGPRRVNKKASVESVKKLTESGLQESTLGHYSYMERTADGETMEEYCVVRHSSSSNRRPIPKPRQTASADKSSKHSNSSVRSSGKAEVLQIQNNGIEVTETVMHIYEGQGCYDNYLANEEYSVDSAPNQGFTPVPGSKQSTDSRPHSLSNDCDIDCSWQPPTADSLQQQKEEMLSLSSDPVPLTAEITNNLSSNSENQDIVKKETTKLPKNKRSRSAGNHNNSVSASSSDALSKASKIKTSKNNINSSTEKLSSDASLRKKSLNSSESTKSGQRAKRGERKLEKPQSKKSLEEEKNVRKDTALSVSAAHVKRTAPKTQNITKALTRDNGHNVNTPSGRSAMKKNMSDILQTKKTTMLAKKTIGKTKSVKENRMSPPENPLEMSESVSMPLLNPSPAEIHQYVESWLENVSADLVPYVEQTVTEEIPQQAKVIFQIGGDSESEEKNESQSQLKVCQPPLGDTMKKSMSCLSVPLHHEGPSTPLLHSEARGLCVSMPSVRVDSDHVGSTLRSHKSAEAIGPEEETSSSHILRPTAKLKPVLKQLCSSIQCIRRASDISTSNLEKSSSLPDFPTQVASVFGSSCKAFLSFLSVMSVRESLKDSFPGDASPSRTTSEAMLMMESLQKISAIEDEDEQRASLSDLQSRASSQFRERWRDFLILRERLESEPLSPKVSETEFALDVISDGEEVFDDQHLRIGELMEELDLPQDLRTEITSTIQQTKSFYPVEESTFLETDRNQSDSEEGVEHFVSDSRAESKPLPEIISTSIDGGIAETKHVDDGEIDQFSIESDREPAEPQEEQEVQENIEIEEAEGDSMNRLDTAEMCDDEEGKEEVEEACVENGEDTDKDTENEDSVEKEEEEADDEDPVVEDGQKDKETEGEQEGNYPVEDTDEREGAEESEEEEDKMKDEAEEEEESEERKAEISKEEEQNQDEYQSSEENTEQGSEGGEADHVSDHMEEEEDEEEEEEEEEEVEEEEVTEEADEKKVIEDGERVEETEADEEEDNVNIVEEEDVGVLSEEEEDIEDVIDVSKEEKVTEESAEDEEDIENVTEENQNANFGGVDEEEDIEGIAGENKEDEAIEENSEEEESTEGTTERINHTNEAVSEEDHGEEENEEEDEREQDKEDIESVEVKNIPHTYDEDTESSKSSEKTRNCVEDEEEKGVESEVETNLRAGQTVDEEEEEEEEDVKEVVEGSEGSSIDNGPDPDPNDELLCSHELTNSGEEDYGESPANSSSECQCEEDKGEGSDSVDDGGQQHQEEHPVEISQDLLDFVNFALKSSSLIFTYDSQGNLRIEPDNARTVNTKHILIPNSKKETLYGSKCLPSPSTSDLSDYRPETSESGGYKSQDSVDIASDSGGEGSEKLQPIRNEGTRMEQLNSNLLIAGGAEALDGTLKHAGSFSSSDSGNKTSKENLSYCSAATSPGAEALTPPVSEKDSPEGVLIDQGRWLLKENHLIRKSPPVSGGMYDNLDSTSVDTNPADHMEASPHHCMVQQNPLVAISSSELEEMARPSTPKCTYYNMLHGSDSDPFLDDSSVRSGRKDLSSVRGRGFRVSPVVDTSRTWANKNGSLSSFASVEFKLPDGRVHPEGQAPAAGRAARTPSGGERALQSQDSLEALHVRCGQYCPIL